MYTIRTQRSEVRGTVTADRDDDRLRRPRGQTRKREGHRSGFTLVMFAMCATLLVGMAGLVIEGGLLMAHQRQAQNAADAAAKAAALYLHDQEQAGVLPATVVGATLRGIADPYVFTHNSIPAVGGSYTLNHPPAAGDYNGDVRAVEVIVTNPMTPVLLTVLGITGPQTAQGRAVAWYGSTAARGAGLVVLDPDPQGQAALAVGGTGDLLVGVSVIVGGAQVLDLADIIVYSVHEGEEEGGLDVHDASLPTIGPEGQPAVAINGGGTRITAEHMYVSGGVDEADNYVNIGTNGDGLDAGTLDPVDDPFHDGSPQLPIPTLSNGVLYYDPLGGAVQQVAVVRGAFPPPPGSGKKNNNPAANGQDGLAVGDFRPALDAPTIGDNRTTAGVTQLFPGIYTDIQISTGNRVNFNPGIYILRPSSSSRGGDILSITGSAFVTGTGVMFYNTGNTYNPDGGTPDQSDLSRASDDRPASNELVGKGIRISATDITLSGLVAPSGVSAPFDRMLFYQRRFNDAGISISQGEGSPQGLTGRLYTKWGNLHLAGDGTFNFALVVGTLSIGGHAQLTTQDRIFTTQLVLAKVRLVE